MSEFWLISAPGDKENLQALERMNTVTSKSNLSYNTKFAIPDFKVGTLDSLVGLSDELGKLDTFAESLIKRMAQSVAEVMEDSKGKVQENLLANGVDLTSFVTHFEWDMAKYPAKQPLVGVVDTLRKQLAQIETDLKTRTAAYNTLKTNLENLQKKSKGNLFTRTLSDIVSKEDFVLDSEYLVTLLVIVPKPHYTQWQKTYESLSDMVVPRSTKLITEDSEGGLFTVTLFRKVIDDFKTKAKENKFMVREFYYDEKEIKREREELTRLLSDKKQQYQTSCVALKKGSSTFPDHKVKVTPLGHPDRPAAGQTDRERESEGEGEVSIPLNPGGPQLASPRRLRRLLRKQILHFLISNLAFEGLNLRSPESYLPPTLQGLFGAAVPAARGAYGRAVCPGWRWLELVMGRPGMVVAAGPSPLSCPGWTHPDLHGHWRYQVGAQSSCSKTLSYPRGPATAALVAAAVAM
ncbi:V-type proton ATPase subunit C 2 isoform X1 [Lemur catta]|uniref:V-type proton ATPase subunit C 2 isoform X1 n=1 Tax=Lemur catta TaxID=9447 RepID=UPI001E26860B|nr:V-type proton ATPase subunit C 2 isoform X1 [Lemur catta]